MIAESEEGLQSNWIKRQEGVAKHGLKVSTSKTEVMMCSESRRNINTIDCNGHALKQVEELKYPKSSIKPPGGLICFKHI